MPPWITAIPGGVEIAVLAQPRASRSRVVGEHDRMLKIQLAAAPTDGEANEELVHTLARLLDVPQARVRLVAGRNSRRKRVRVEGVEPTAAIAAMHVGR
ncbi:MAG TPA: DUF167 domain-containing protein [Myxococcaceae bacterium]|nr:DUF167 domain-containing protein [Myxococcaceae bacterium]